MLMLHSANENRILRVLGRLDIGVASSKAVAVISVAGELDVSNHHRLRECLREVSEAGATEIILDVEHLTFMDSTGLAVLVASHRRMEAAGGSFSLLAPTHIVKRLLDMTGQLRYQMTDNVAV